jgi:hypothetical protein
MERHILAMKLDKVGEPVLGDLGYIGVEMYVLRRVHRRDIPGDPNAAAVAEAFNRRHAAERIKVEWGIGCLNERFRTLLTNYPTRRGSFLLCVQHASSLPNLFIAIERNLPLSVLLKVKEIWLQRNILMLITRTTTGNITDTVVRI